MQFENIKPANKTEAEEGLLKEVSKLITLEW